MKSLPLINIVVPPSAQIPTPGREFLLRTPIEGVSYIAAAVKNAGYPVNILDIRGTDWTVPQAANMLISNGGIVAIATYVDSFPFTKELTALLKKNRPDLTIIMGGPLVSSMPKVLMENTAADYAVIGEGENTILELLNAVAQQKDNSIENIDGIAHRNKDNLIKYAPRRKEIENLDILPNADLSLWPSVKENNEVPEIGFSSSRGCHQNCHFCYKLYRKVRYQSPAKFGANVAELVKKHNIKYAYINDLTFVANRARTLEICRELAQTGINWSCSTRVENIDLELLQNMRQAGCTDIWYGIESVDQSVLDAMHKGQDLALIEQVLHTLAEAGIATYIYLLFGTPSESLAEARRTMDFVIRHHQAITFLNLAVFNMPTGSPEAPFVTRSEFYGGDLSLYTDFTHPKGWSRKEIRRFLDQEFKRQPAIARILHRDPPLFTSNHAAFFC